MELILTSLYLTFKAVKVLPVHAISLRQLVRNYKAIYFYQRPASETFISDNEAKAYVSLFEPDLTLRTGDVSHVRTPRRG